jgi:hypothetical protein
MEGSMGEVVYLSEYRKSNLKPRPAQLAPVFEVWAILFSAYAAFWLQLAESAPDRRCAAGCPV